MAEDSRVGAEFVVARKPQADSNLPSRVSGPERGARSQCVFPQVRGRNAIIWQTQKTATAATARPPTARPSPMASDDQLPS